jgi:hypothetical protein
MKTVKRNVRSRKTVKRKYKGGGISKQSRSKNNGAGTAAPRRLSLGRTSQRILNASVHAMTPKTPTQLFIQKYRRLPTQAELLVFIKHGHLPN